VGGGPLAFEPCGIGPGPSGPADRSDDVDADAVDPAGNGPQLPGEGVERLWIRTEYRHVQ